MEKRDELNRLLRDCKKGKIDRIITKSVSRLARNTEEMLIMLRLLKEQGVSVYFEEQGIDTNQLNLEMIVTFPGMTAQQESAAISGNLRWGIQKKMENGAFVCSNPPYGYKLENKQLVVCEAEAIIIRRIFDLFLQGMGKQAIASLLNEEEQPRRRGYCVWHMTAIDYILRNEKYMGDAVLEKTYMTESLPYKQKRNKGEKTKYYVEQYCPAIISKEKYISVQELILSRREDRGGVKVYALTGRMRCPECGRAFRRQTINQKAYWNCALLAVQAGKCKSRRVREDMAYETFTVMTYKLKAHRQQIIEETIQRLEYLQSRTSENGERIQEIDKAIADLSAKNHVITRLHTSGVMGVTEYTQQTSEIGNKITALRSERRKKLTEDETDMLLDELKTLNEIMKEYQPR
ncbi:MAG: recombinase family protein, partial [Christensenellaceae bacterium]